MPPSHKAPKKRVLAMSKRATPIDSSVAVFVHVVRDGSFAAAGRRLGIPSNTLSRRVRHLETMVNAPLLRRSTRKLGLTGAGQDFFEACVGSLDEIEEALQALLDSGREPSGRVKVAAPAEFFEIYGADLLSEFLARYPRVQLVFVVSDEKADLIGAAIDVAFRAGELEGSSLSARRLGDNEYGLFASPEYLARQGAPTEPELLQSKDCLVISGQTNKALWRLRGPRGTFEVPVTGRLAANAVRPIMVAARAGLGIALLPLNLVERDLAERRLVRSLPDYRDVRGGVYAVFPTRRQRALAVTVFVDHVIARLATGRLS